jgi:hypothetical protein
VHLPKYSLDASPILESDEIHDVRHDHSRGLNLITLEPFITVVGLDDTVSLILQYFSQQVPYRCIVINN